MASETVSHDQLHRSCRRLTWPNRLLRFSGFVPKVRGVRTILPHAGDFRGVNNLQSIADLAAALSNKQHSSADLRRHFKQRRVA
ncbi:hypothetical protein E2F50_06865 [Rhizobium deserti]|uniref:Uncharacterized protein n=1 Tax=Rhizobium deserti TaxID=2547961 RepID=A0A4R5UIJ5_9HYPH|nr:hypothetical protein [Rhizobium deserti]TDK36642.1 hypothetical protein E2F50_06865 [Rhizobium deserti]